MSRRPIRPLLKILSASPMSLRQVSAQRPINRLIRPQQVIIDLGAPRRLAQFLAEALEVLQIFLAQSIRINQYLVARRFQIAELRPFFERKFDLFGSEDVKQQHFMPAMTEVLQSSQQRLNLLEAIRQDDDESALLDLLGRLMPQRRQRRLAARLRFLQGV